MRFSSEPLCHTKRHDKYIFTQPPTHLKRQIEVLRDETGMDVAPNWLQDILKAFEDFKNKQKRL